MNERAAEQPASARPKYSVERICVSVYRIPTDLPEADGTLSWQKTVLVTVEATCQGAAALGYTYAHAATAQLIQETLAPLALGADALAPNAVHTRMQVAIRNLGADGIAAMAISALDLALWDLKARLLELPLASLLGAERTSVPVYGSGGFTSYDRETLERQLSGWVRAGMTRVKIKVGARPDEDVHRVRAAREVIGEAQLFVDANGAHSAKHALRQAAEFAQFGVTWFEEPVSSDDRAGLRLVRERGPSGMDIAAGEYGYRPSYFLRLLQARAVDVLQVDATRCGGVTGFLRAANLAEAFGIPLSSHCAPALHLHLGCACATLRHLEYFHDHARIERELLGASTPGAGSLSVDSSQHGFGLRLERERAAAYHVSTAESCAR
jgi:L-alanine-DL-glutamate epimerase-like enolase superfamily enzyme